VKGPADLLAAVELEAQYSLTALSGHGLGTIDGPSTLACPAPALSSSTSPGFLGDLEKDMAADPPTGADGPVVQAMAAAGIGPGRTPGTTSSTNAAEYLQALSLGAGLLAAPAGEGSATIWTGYTRGAVVGSYGTDYLDRARLAEETLGTQVPTQAVYIAASRARSGTTTTPLAGTSSYEIRFGAKDLPPRGSEGDAQPPSPTVSRHRQKANAGPAPIPSTNYSGSASNGSAVHFAPTLRARHASELYFILSEQN
jgi:hypothetical protein